jgi:hypothetical protein
MKKEPTVPRLKRIFISSVEPLLRRQDLEES